MKKGGKEGVSPCAFVNRVHLTPTQLPSSWDSEWAWEEGAGEQLRKHTLSRLINTSLLLYPLYKLEIDCGRSRKKILEGFKKALITMGKLKDPAFTNQVDESQGMGRGTGLESKSCEGFLTSLCSLFVPYSRFRFLGGNLLTSLISPGYSSRLGWVPFMARPTTQWRMGSSSKTLCSSFSVYPVMCWDQLALAQDRWRATLSNFMFRGISLGASEQPCWEFYTMEVGKWYKSGSFI